MISRSTPPFWRTVSRSSARTASTLRSAISTSFTPPIRHLSVSLRRSAIDRLPASRSLTESASNG
jgi:hypothetical protein